MQLTKGNAALIADPRCDSDRRREVTTRMLTEDRQRNYNSISFSKLHMLWLRVKRGVDIPQRTRAVRSAHRLSAGSRTIGNNGPLIDKTSASASAVTSSRFTSCDNRETVIAIKIAVPESVIGL